jgi:arylsulfatase A-like enzyme
LRLPATGSRKFLDRAIIEQRALAPADLDHVVALYDGEVLATDSQIDALWQGLLEEGLLDRSIVIVTADHGEELGQHARYFYHACSTYDAVLHIPLLIRLPGARLAGMRVPQVVENLDIMPTVLELLGVDLLDSYEGQSMLPLLNSEPSAADSFSSSFAEYYRARIGWVRSIRTKRWRYIYNPEEIVPRCRPNHGYFELAAEELYDHRVDPKELNNVLASHPEVAAELKRELLGALADRDPPPPALRADPEVLQQLKELGYLGD